TIPAMGILRPLLLLSFLSAMDDLTCIKQTTTETGREYTSLSAAAGALYQPFNRAIPAVVLASRTCWLTTSCQASSTGMTMTSVSSSASRFFPTNFTSLARKKYNISLQKPGAEYMPGNSSHTLA